MKAKIKIGLALLAAAFLLVSPSGRCIQVSDAKAPAHPCHSRIPAPIPEDCGKPGCVYVKATIVEISGESGDVQRPSIAYVSIPARVMDTLVIGVVPAQPSVVPPFRDLLSLFHQLVI